MKRTKQLHGRNDKLTPDQAWQFLENFSAMAHGKDEKTEMISLRVPGNILQAFKAKSQEQELKYQSQIIKLMRQWILDSK